MTSVWNRVLDWFDLMLEELLRWDQQALEAVSENRVLHKLSMVFVTATYFGDGYLWGGLALGLIFLGRPIDRSYVLIGLGVSLINIAVFRLFKLLFSRPRPRFAIISLQSRLIDTYSFPSGHSTTSFGLALVIAHFYPFTLVQGAAYLVAAVIAVSRVYVREHYPLDVICGALLGSAVAWWLLPILNQVVF